MSDIEQDGGLTEGNSLKQEEETEQVHSPLHTRRLQPATT